MTALALSLSAALLLAQADDFEGLTLGTGDSPAGRWLYSNSYDQSSSLLRGVAARRGSQGVRFQDATSIPSDGTETRLGGLWPSRVPRLLGRVWVRTSAMSANGADFVLNINTDWGGGRFSLAAVGFAVPGYGLSLQAYDQAGAVTETPLPALRLEPGTWHLVELMADGMGTTNGCVRLAFDGTPAHETCGLVLTGATTPLPGFGLIWQSPRVGTGYLDVDDAAFDTDLVASKLVLAPLSATPQTGDCVQLSASTESSWGGAAPSAFDELVAIEGPFSLFSDAACTQPVAGLQLRAHQSTATVYVKPLEPGAQTVRARPLSVIAGALPSWSVSGGAITPLTPLEASCGCTSGEAGVLALAAAATALRRRGARRPTT